MTVNMLPLQIVRRDMETVSGGSPAFALLYQGSALACPDLFPANAILCPAEISRSVSSRQLEFLAGRMAARQALRWLECPTADAPLEVGESREPQWPEGYTGSITHSGDFAAAVAGQTSEYKALGIDIIRVPNDSEADALIDIVVTDYEADILSQCAGGMTRSQRLGLAFSAKESFFKGAYKSVQTFFDFSAVRLTALDMPNRQLTLTLTETLCTDYLAGQECRVSFDWINSDHLITLFFEAQTPGRYATKKNGFWSL